MIPTEMARMALLSLLHTIAFRVLEATGGKLSDVQIAAQGG